MENAWKALPHPTQWPKRHKATCCVISVFLSQTAQWAPVEDEHQAVGMQRAGVIIKDDADGERSLWILKQGRGKTGELMGRSSGNRGSWVRM